MDTSTHLSLGSQGLAQGEDKIQPPSHTWLQLDAHQILSITTSYQSTYREIK